MALALLAACASSPPALSNDELGGQLDRALQVHLTASRDSLVARFAPDARMVLRNVVGPDGELVHLDLVGIDQISMMIAQSEMPDDFAMTVRHFERQGSEATQTGDWRMVGQRGTFIVRWGQVGGEWRIALWQLDRSS
jgi:hypothetical protein